MKQSGKFVNDYNWWKTLTNYIGENGVNSRFKATCDDAKEYPCDNCGSKTLEVYAVNREYLHGTPLNKYDYYCKSCTEKEFGL